MIPLARWKVVISIIFCFIGLLYSVPSFLTDAQMKSMPSWWPNSSITLGLDLQGGAQILLEADFKQAFHDRYEGSVDALRGALRKSKLGYRSINAHNDHIMLVMRDPERYKDCKKECAKTLGYKVDVERVKEDRLRIAFKPEVIEEIKNVIMEQSRSKIDSRVNELGTSEPNIMRQGANRIIVQLPGVKDPDGLQKIIGKTAKLTFHKVVEEGESKNVVGGVVSYPVVDKGYEASKDATHKLMVYRKPFVSGDNLVEAYEDIDKSPGGMSRPLVHMGFDGTGSRKFSQMTRENIGKRFAVVLDGNIITAPVIQGHISGGSGQISGNFTPNEAKDLAMLMRSGSLPTPLNTIEEITVGPDLGADSISKGRMATVISIVLVSLFMLLAYTVYGVLADIALIFNIILLIAGMVIINATLTLEGIAGIALTIGMAVDANVLIFERIKEEYRKGIEPSVSIQDGFDKAISTILDSNITTLIGAVVLFAFGSSFVRGFAITLSMGILISMFTAVTLTKVMIVTWYNATKSEEF